MASSEVVKATKSLTTAAKLRQDTQMIMQPYANWEEYLTPAPMSITVLGELVFISSKDDFSINQNPPKDGFKYIKYPNSFRATLMQVCNAGWSAFNEAHTSMDQIRLHTANVPKYVKKAVEVILTDDNRLFKAVLPNTLETIENIVSECLRLSNSTKDKFERVILLVHEVLEAGTNAKEAYNTDLKNVQQEIAVNEIRRASREEADKRTEEDMKKFKAAIDEAEETFKKALDSMPSGWDMIGMNLAEGLAETFGSLVSGLTNIITLNFGKMFGGGGGGGGSGGQTSEVDKEKGEEQMSKYYALKDVYLHHSIIVNMTKALMDMTEGKKMNWQDLYDQKNQKAKSSVPKNMLNETKTKLLQCKESEPKTTALAICSEAIALCSKIESIAPAGECEQSEEQRIISEIDSVHEKAQAFSTKAKTFLNSPRLPQTAPGVSKAQAKGMKAAEFAAQNARVKIEETRKALDTARTMYNQAVERYEKNKNELTEVLITLKNCNVKEIDFKTTLEILAKGLQALGRVKEQWEKMVRFFQIVTSIITVSLKTSSKDFVDSAKQSAGYSSNTMLKDMVYNEAFQISNISNLVHMIASTYTEISDKYIMERVSSLGKLMALDIDSPEFDRERQKLEDGCTEAQKGIVALVQKNKSDFNKKTEDRMAQLESLRALLPPPTKEEEEKVKRITEVSNDSDIDQFI